MYKGLMLMKKTIGILYICTGPYVLFWQDFFESFERFFLPELEKKYYVFTDADCIYAEEQDNVRKIYIENQPWPLITLFRFATFLKIEKELASLDYLMFSNSNMICAQKVTMEEFLPRKELGETISVTIHPGYYKKSSLKYPYERNKKSTAYIPWNCGESYVIGAMYSGTSSAFIKMCRTLKRNIEEDLKKNIIAIFHDESQLNRYIIGKKGIRIISPEYCYPYGMSVEYPKKIYAVSKQEKFDIKSFKGHYDVPQNNIRHFLGTIKRKLMIKERILYLFDSIFGYKICEVEDEE